MDVHTYIHVRSMYVCMQQTFCQSSTRFNRIADVVTKDEKIEATVGRKGPSIFDAMPHPQVLLFNQHRDKGTKYNGLIYKKTHSLHHMRLNSLFILLHPTSCFPSRHCWRGVQTFLLMFLFLLAMPRFGGLQAF